MISFDNNENGDWYYETTPSNRICYMCKFIELNKA